MKRAGSLEADAAQEGAKAKLFRILGAASEPMTAGACVWGGRVGGLSGWVVVVVAVAAGMVGGWMGWEWFVSCIMRRYGVV